MVKKHYRMAALKWRRPVYACANLRRHHAECPEAAGRDANKPTYQHASWLVKAKSTTI
jgi:hypothetical protein